MDSVSFKLHMGLECTEKRSLGKYVFGFEKLPNV